MKQNNELSLEDLSPKPGASLAYNEAKQISSGSDESGLSKALPEILLKKLSFFTYDKKKGSRAEYYLEKEWLCINGSVDFGRVLTLKEARKEISSKCKISPEDPRLIIQKLR